MTMLWMLPPDMAAHLAGALRQAQRSHRHSKPVRTHHRALHHSQDRNHQTKEADHPAPAEALQRVIGGGQNTCWKRRNKGTEYHFPSPITGELYHPDSVVNLHKKILKDAGLPHIRFHDLRHTFATTALQNGVDVKTVSSMLGHYDAGFTLRTYTHVTRQKQDEAAQTMGSFMEQVM